MLLAWNYQNSAAIRNNANGPDLTTMTNLWEQYQNALTGINVNKTSDGAIGSPVSIYFFIAVNLFFSTRKIKKNLKMLCSGQGH